MATVPSAKEHIIGEFIRLWVDPNASESFTNLFTEDCLYEDLALNYVFHGRKEIKGYHQYTHTAFPGCTCLLHQIMLSASHAAVVWCFEGLHSQEFGGFAATRQMVKVPGVSIIEFQEEKMKHVTDYWDLGAVLKQFGLFPKLSGEKEERDIISVHSGI